METDDLPALRPVSYLPLLVLVPSICVARLAAEQLASLIFHSYLPAALINKKKRRVRFTLQKFQESFWKLLFYSVSSPLAIHAVYSGGFLYTPYDTFPDPVEGIVYWVYMLEISFYSWLSVSMFWDVRRKDFLQMAVHHFVTLALLYMSCSWNCSRIGVIVIALHDIADPFLEAGKMFNYLQLEKPASVLFGIFIALFYIPRLLVFPVLVLWPTHHHSDRFMRLGFSEILYMCCGSLWVLLGLNVYWARGIGNVALSKLRAGAGAPLKDWRSDSD